MKVEMKSERYHVLRPMGLAILSISCLLIADMQAKAGEPLKWTLAASKAAYYPGEPVELAITIQNAGPSDEDVYLGAFGIGAFSFDLCDNSGRTIAQGGRVKGEEGALSSRFSFIKVPTGQTAKRSVVLNRWCSTLVPPGEYRVICRADYSVKSEATPIPGATRGFRLDASHVAKISLDVNIVKADPPKYEDVLANLETKEMKERQPGEDFAEHHESQQVAAEMIAFCEWPEAVPYQLRAARMRNDPWVRLSVIRKLGKSKSLEAANGLMAMADAPSVQNYRLEIITAIHALHASDKKDIVEATDAFVKQNPLPVPAREGG
jgi:hypothetical protein